MDTFAFKGKGNEEETACRQPQKRRGVVVNSQSTQILEGCEMAEECRGGLSTLPWEVLCNILERVHRDVGNQVLLCMEVCKDWHAAVQATASTLKLVNCHRPLPALQMIANFERLEMLRVVGCGRQKAGGWEAAFEALGAGCPRLAAIHVINAGNILEYEDIASLALNCTTIKTLELSRCTVSRLLPPLHYLTALESLTIFENPALDAIPPLHSFTRLTTLELSYLPHLHTLPPLHTISNLLSLDLAGCHSLQQLPPLHNSPLLQFLDVSLCEHLKELDVTQFPGLRSLVVSGCRHLSQIGGLETHRNLRSLSTSWCRALHPWPEIHRIRSLTDLLTLPLTGRAQSLCLASFPRLRRLEAMFAFKRLALHPLCAPEELTLSHCFHPHPLPSPGNLRKLRSLKLYGCANMRDLDALQQIVTLEELKVDRCVSLVSLPHVIARLKSLVMRDCDLIEAIPLVEQNAVLTLLQVHCCQALVRLPQGLEDLAPNLCHLELHSCSSLESLPPLARLLSLTRLEISICRRIPSLPPMPVSLRFLEVAKCPGMTEFPRFDSLVLLHELRLSGTGISDVPAPPSFSGLISLNTLSLMRSHWLREVPPLAGLVSLRELDVSLCDRLERMPPLRDLERLRTVSILGCQHLQDFEFLKGLRAEVEVVGAPDPREAPGYVRYVTFV